MDLGVRTIVLGFKYLLEPVQVLVSHLKRLKNPSGTLRVAPYIVQTPPHLALVASQPAHLLGRRALAPKTTASKPSLYTPQNRPPLPPSKPIARVVKNQMCKSLFDDFTCARAGFRESSDKTIIINLLIIRYLERIADHASYIAEAITYAITGKRLELR